MDAISEIGHSIGSDAHNMALTAWGPIKPDCSLDLVGKGYLVRRGNSASR
jgi:hypothetical protein